MIYLIVGTPDSGKSKLAEDLISSVSGDKRKYYIATMIPYGEEGALRVSKHRAMREGKGFDTLEIPFDVCDAAISGHSAVLLECVSNLAANELFERKTPDEECEEKIIRDIHALSGKADEIVIVTNHFEVTDDFDDDTVRYAVLMDRINNRLRGTADKLIDLTEKQ